MAASNESGTERLAVSIDHCLSLEISTEKMKDKKEKKNNYKLSTLDEITSYICALLNSGGGTLKITYSDKNEDDKCLRMIEQRLINKIGTTSTNELLKIEENGEEILINATQSPSLVTVKYNLYIPTVTQVNEIPATDRRKNIRKILTRRLIDDWEDIRSHGDSEIVFNKGKESGLKEKTNVQLKCVKSESSGSKSTTLAKSTTVAKSTTLADRIVNKNNKFKCTVSSFANHQGGCIYYGILDNGEVEGQKVEETKNIEEKVEKSIKDMKWPMKEPKRGEQWDIFFKEVFDNAQPVPHTFVILIYIAPCSGGVFTEEPESYYIENKNPKKFSFDQWRSRFLCVSTVTHVSRVKWSCKENKEMFVNLSEKLVDLRDAGKYDAFTRLCNTAKEKFSENNAEQIVKAGEVTIAYKSHDFQKARTLLSEFQELLRTSKDPSIFEARFLLSKCLVKRSEGNYEESYNIAKDGIQRVLENPVGLCALWLYLETAMNAARIAMTKDDQSEERVSLRKEALHYLEQASEVACMLEKSNTQFRNDDFRHKLCIYKTWVLLNCAVTGEVTQQMIPSREDIDSAGKQLAIVDRNLYAGKPLTVFREIEHYLAKSDLFRQRCDALKEDKINNLRKAKENSLKARDLAEKKKFQNLFSYSETRLQYIDTQLDDLEAAADEKSTTSEEYFMDIKF